MVNSPAGQAAAAFQLPFAPLELENFLLRAGRPRQGVRGFDTTELDTAKAFGQKLFTSVFDDEVRACLHSSLQAAAEQGAGLRIRLRLGDAPELADLPWEFLYNAALNRFFTLSVETPLVRYLKLPEAVRALKVTPPLQALVMIANPADYETLDVEQEWSRLHTALAGLEARGLLTLERLDEATLPALQRRLREQQYHIFHFIGHGGFDQGAGEGVLILEDDAGRGRAVGGEYVGTLLHDHRPLRLAVLNACEGGRGSAKDSFAGVAQSLIQQGLPAVIAMQFPISDVAAITFARDFYGAVADGYPVDAALAEARKAILSDGGGLEWGTPVLFMRADSGYIFEVENAPPALPTATPASAGHQRASVAPVQPAPATSPGKELPRVTPVPRRRGANRKGWMPAVALLVLLVLGVLFASRLLPERLVPTEQAGEVAAGAAPTSALSTDNPAVTPAADAPDSAAPAVVLDSGMEATAGKVVYRVLAARLEPRDSGTRALHLDVRMTNMDLGSLYIGAEAFRLLVDGVPLAPSEAPSIAVEGQSATEGEAVFVLPTSAGKVELQFGTSGTESSPLAIDLNARQESAPPTPAVPPLAQSLYVGGDMDITVSKMVYRILAAHLEPHSVGKRTLRSTST